MQENNADLKTGGIPDRELHLRDNTEAVSERPYSEEINNQLGTHKVTESQTQSSA